MEHTSEMKNRAIKCAEEVTAILKKYNCYIDGRAVITNAGCRVDTSILPKPSDIKIASAGSEKSITLGK